jgi:hypothetical protein
MVLTKNNSIFLSFWFLNFMLIGPSGVRVLPWAAGINEGGHYFRYIIGSSRVRALPLAAGINESGHYFW